MGSAADILAGAKVAGAKAEKDFPGSMAAAAGVKPSGDRKVIANKSTVAPAPPAKVLSDSGTGIKVRRDTEKQYHDANPDSPITPAYHKGTKKVEKTGPALLEKGEAVIPKDKAMANKGLIEGLLDGKDEKESKSKAGKKKEAPEEAKKVKGAKEGTKKVKKLKHRVHTIHIKRANGGFIANHDHEPDENGMLPTSEQNPPHVMSSMDELKKHMEDHMGDEAPAGGAGLAQAQPSPAMPS